MNQVDDTVRMIQILQNETYDKDHIFNRFLWGNRESLLGIKKQLDEDDLEDEEIRTKIEALVDDVRTFFKK